MEPKSELLVFNKKEVIVIIVLLVLVAMFSFTLGLKLGKTLGTATAVTAEHAPLVAKNEGTAVQSLTEHATSSELSGSHKDPTLDSSTPSTTKTSHGSEAPADNQPTKKKSGHENSAAQVAEDRADAELNAEVGKENVGLAKPVPMTLPKEKKGSLAVGVKYTLQVGAYRTVAEATEQVTTLKHKDIDAFYLEAQIKGKGTWYRVGIGVFPSKENAESTAAKWKESKALPPYIVQKIN